SNLKSTSLDLLNEGRNAPARQKWVVYYLSTAKDDASALKSDAALLAASGKFSAIGGTQWADAQAQIQQLDGLISALDKEVQNLKAPTDDKYPPVFWKTSQDLSAASDKLDKALIEIFNIVDAKFAAPNTASTSDASSVASGSAGSSAPSTGEPLKGGARMVDSVSGFKHIDDASKRISKACWGLFGELERWNLLYGKPPSTGIGDMFYGGGLSKEEVMSEYKYLPQFTFTNAPYVMLYSYRLPPRQNMLAYYTGQIGKLMNLLEGELNDVQIPADRQMALAGPWNQTKQLFLDSRKDYLALLNLVNNTSDARLQKNIREDQTAFGQPLMALYGDMAKMRDAITDINKMLK
ncbi:MAG: hypothetical protein K2X81_16225, partial [Candidatus Obscuribacterales bacterium]|nr:hypothetical protein [Candidatus Obscuribacterales bacterium]